MLPLALGREAGQADAAVREHGRPLGAPRWAGKRITQAQSKCHSNICRAECNCLRTGFQCEGQGWKSCLGSWRMYVERCSHFVEYSLPFTWVGCVLFCFDLYYPVWVWGLAVPQVDRLCLRKPNANLWGLILEGKRKLYILLNSLSNSFYFVCIFVL